MLQMCGSASLWRCWQEVGPSPPMLVFAVNELLQDYSMMNLSLPMN